MKKKKKTKVGTLVIKYTPLACRKVKIKNTNKKTLAWNNAFRLRGLSWAYLSSEFRLQPKVMLRIP